MPSRERKYGEVQLLPGWAIREMGMKYKARPIIFAYFIGIGFSARGLIKITKEAIQMQARMEWSLEMEGFFPVNYGNSPGIITFVDKSLDPGGGIDIC